MSDIQTNFFPGFRARQAGQSGQAGAGQTSQSTSSPFGRDRVTLGGEPQEGEPAAWTQRIGGQGLVSTGGSFDVGGGPNGANVQVSGGGQAGVGGARRGATVSVTNPGGTTHTHQGGMYGGARSGGVHTWGGSRQSSGGGD